MSEKEKKKRKKKEGEDEPHHGTLGDGDDGGDL